MTCTKPIRLGSGFVVPCGHCMACRIKRTQEWATRLMDEAAYYKKSVFVTLTYDEEHVPINGSLVKEDLQLYMKRLRKSIEPEKIKFYASGEYGETKGRPHYHLIIFNMDVKDKKIFENAWKRGRVHCGECNELTCRYVASYVQKKLNGPKAKEVYGEKEAPFQLCSRGLGKRWALDNRNYLNAYKSITVKGKPVGIPRYYVKVIPDLDLGKLDYWSDGMIADDTNDRALAREDKLNAIEPDPTKQWKLAQAKRDQDNLVLIQKNERKRKNKSL